MKELNWTRRYYLNKIIDFREQIGLGILICVVFNWISCLPLLEMEQKFGGWMIVLAILFSGLLASMHFASMQSYRGYDITYESRQIQNKAPGQYADAAIYRRKRRTRTQKLFKEIEQITILPSDVNKLCLSYDSECCLLDLS
jgi:hypothetical protein